MVRVPVAARKGGPATPPTASSLMLAQMIDDVLYEVMQDELLRSVRSFGTAHLVSSGSYTNKYRVSLELLTLLHISCE